MRLGALDQGPVARALRAHGIGELPVPDAPLSLPLALRAEIAAASEALHRELETLAHAHYFAGEALADLCIFNDVSRALCAEAARPGDLFAVTRLDFALSDGAHRSDRDDVSRSGSLVSAPAADAARGARSAGPRIAFLECNAGDPSGMGWNDVLAAAFAQLPAHAEVRIDRLLPSLETLLVARAAVAKPRIVCLCADDSFVRSDHEAIAAFLRGRGHDAVVCDPRRFVLGSARELRDTMLFRDTIDELVSAPFLAETAPLRERLRRREVCVTNPLAAVIGDDKTLFAELSARQTPAARAFLPWTRRLTPALAETVRHERASYVLKPADGYGGFDVTVGCAVSEAAWQTALDRARDGGRHLVQAYVPLARRPFASETEPRFVTMSAWLHAGRFVGCYARTSPAHVVNVHQGGALLPVAWI